MASLSDSGVLAAAGAIVASAVAVWVKGPNRRQEKRESSRDNHEDQLLKSMRDFIKQLEDRIDVLTKRVDDFAEQRNIALADNARLQEKVSGLTEEVHRLEAEVAELQGTYEKASRATPGPNKPPRPGAKTG